GPRAHRAAAEPRRSTRGVAGAACGGVGDRRPAGSHSGAVSTCPRGQLAAALLKAGRRHPAGVADAGPRRPLFAGTDAAL
ncbi:MAG: hypothetical protein RMJ52_06445, partial [Gemmataceae bacterium]|nr:hypothetical protein [Gemmataceae bacterium]